MLLQLPAAYRLAYALTGRPEDAETLVQDAYAQAADGLRGRQQESDARVQLLAVVYRTFRNYDRRLQARRRSAPSASLELYARPGGREDAAVLTVLCELPESFRVVLALVDLEGMRYAEAAAVLDWPTDRIMVQVHRARLEVARRLPPPRAESGGVVAGRASVSRPSSD
jgi:RNA polymerase sigma-70 factor (ECF subfamily)